MTEVKENRNSFVKGDIVGIMGMKSNARYLVAGSVDGKFYELLRVKREKDYPFAGHKTMIKKEAGEIFYASHKDSIDQAQLEKLLKEIEEAKKSPVNLLKTTKVEKKEEQEDLDLHGSNTTGDSIKVLPKVDPNDLNF